MTGESLTVLDSDAQLGDAHLTLYSSSFPQLLFLHIYLYLISLSCLLQRILAALAINQRVNERAPFQALSRHVPEIRVTVTSSCQFLNRL